MLSKPPSKIEDGDILVVDTAKSFRNGQVVLARLGDDLLVKRAYRENSHVRLKADAPGYSDIVDREIAVLGVVVEIRKVPA